MESPVPPGRARLDAAPFWEPCQDAATRLAAFKAEATLSWSAAVLRMSMSGGSYLGELTALRAMS